MPALLRQLLIWTVVCGISAAPSFFIALGGFNEAAQILAMLAGIGCFIVAYTLVSCTPLARRLRRKPFVMTTLKIGYGTRMLISAIAAFASGGSLPPAIPDVWIGYISVMFVLEHLTLDEDSAFTVFVTTITVGTLWNVALTIYMLLIHGVQLAFRKKPPPSGACQTCGYDLRASSGVCPECGTPIPPPASPPLAA